MKKLSRNNIILYKYMYIKTRNLEIISVNIWLSFSFIVVSMHCIYKNIFSLSGVILCIQFFPLNTTSERFPCWSSFRHCGFLFPAPMLGLLYVVHWHPMTFLLPWPFAPLEEREPRVAPHHPFLWSLICWWEAPDFCLRVSSKEGRGFFPPRDGCP